MNLMGELKFSVGNYILAQCDPFRGFGQKLSSSIIAQRFGNENKQKSNLRGRSKSYVTLIKIGR